MLGRENPDGAGQTLWGVDRNRLHYSILPDVYPTAIDWISEVQGYRHRSQKTRPPIPKHITTANEPHEPRLEESKRLRLDNYRRVLS